MHSSRMRTARLLTYPGGGGGLPGRESASGGVCIQGALPKRVCIRGGGVCPTPPGLPIGGVCIQGGLPNPPGLPMGGGVCLGWVCIWEGGLPNPCRSAYGEGVGRPPPHCEQNDTQV